MGDTAESMARLSGYNCGAKDDCLQDDGSGYYLVKSQEMGLAHCAVVTHPIFWNSFDATDKTTYLCDYTNGIHKCSMKANFDWLAATARAPGSQVFACVSL